MSTPRIRCLSIRKSINNGNGLFAVSRVSLSRHFNEEVVTCNHILLKVIFKIQEDLGVHRVLE